MWASHSLSNRVLGIGAASGGGGATLRLTRTRDAIGDLEPGQRAGLEDVGAGTRACELAAVDARGHAGLALGILSVGHAGDVVAVDLRSEEHTSELQSLMRISYAVFCLKKTHYHYS